MATMRRRLRILALILAALTMGYCIHWTYYENAAQYYSLLKENAEEGSSACIMPQVDPYDPSIRKYLNSKVEPLRCKQLQYEFTYLRNGRIYINETEFTASGYTAVKCKFRCFDRKLDDDVALEYGDWIQLQLNGTSVKCEFVEVRCCKNSFPPINIYVNLHSQVIPRVSNSNSTDSLPTSKDRALKSVLLFVVDSVSASNWKRNLPKTLAELNGHYKSYLFSGFTKVGDNSFPNAVAFLTGKRVNTAGYENEIQENTSQSFFDDWPILWKDYAQQGYATLYAEDYPQFNLFKYLSNGFKKRPTHHYFRPYWLQLYGSFLHRRSTHLCYGNSPSHRLQLSYLSAFLEKYSAYNSPSHAPTFALNWLTELGHDWLGQVSLGDDDFSSFFAENRKKLREAFVFVFSDHGHRFDPIRQSLIGRIEERMPFFSMHVPKSLLEEYPHLHDVIERNSRQLSSFWDLYITLRDILHLQKVGWEDLAVVKGQPQERFRKYSPRGLSLLRPLPARTCEQAGIPDDFCVCQREKQVNVSDQKVVTAASEIISHVNGLLSNHSKKCAYLSLHRILAAQTIVPPAKAVMDPHALSGLIGSIFTQSSWSLRPTASIPHDFYINYRVTVEAVPNGMFEGMVREYAQKGTLKVVGDVNRISKYGNQSECLNSPILRKYCYCI